MLSAIPPKAGRTASGRVMSGSLFAAAVSSLVTQRLSAFRSYLAPAYRLCCAPRLFAESSEPSGKGFVPQPLPPVSSALTASSRSASTRSLTLRRRPDSHARSVLASCLYSTVNASGGVTVVPRSNLIPSAACRAVPAWLLAFLLLREMSADAATPERAKPPSPTTLTHAPSACLKSPASHARPGHQGYINIPGWRLRRRCLQRHYVPCMLVDTSQLKTSSRHPHPYMLSVYMQCFR